MRRYFLLLFIISMLCVSTPSGAETYDVIKEYTCDQPSNGVWYFEAYRHSDGKYLPMVFGHAPLTEISKYGADAHYLPDGKQPYYPFITLFDSTLFASPSTSGDKFDAVLAWASPYACDVASAGSVRLTGDIKGGAAAGKKVKASLLLGDKTLWSAEVAGDSTAEFSVKSTAAVNDRLRLQVENAGDASGNIVVLQMRVETTKK